MTVSIYLREDAAKTLLEVVRARLKGSASAERRAHLQNTLAQLEGQILPEPERERDH